MPHIVPLVFRNRGGGGGGGEASPTKRGVRKDNYTELSGSTGNSAPGLSLMTLSYTPLEANARIFVRMQIAYGIAGNSDNDFAKLIARVKRGSGNYKRMDEQADGYTEVAGRRAWQYVDTVGWKEYAEYMLQPQANKDQITLNVSVYSADGNTVVSTTGYLNRNNNRRNTGPSFLEIYEEVAGGTMTYSTSNTLDSA